MASKLTIVEALKQLIDALAGGGASDVYAGMNTTSELIWVLSQFMSTLHLAEAATYRAKWAEGTVYTPGAIVQNTAGTAMYIAIEVASAGESPDTAAAKWVKLADITPSA